MRNRDELKDDAIAQGYRKLKEDSNWHEIYFLRKGLRMRPLVVQSQSHILYD